MTNTHFLILAVCVAVGAFVMVSSIERGASPQQAATAMAQSGIRTENDPACHYNSNGTYRSGPSDCPAETADRRVGKQLMGEHGYDHLSDQIDRDWAERQDACKYHGGYGRDGTHFGC